MANETVVIDVIARFEDKVTNAAKKAKKSVRDFEDSIDKLEKKKHSVRIDADTKRADSGIRKLMNKANTFGRKHFKGVFSVIDYASPKINKTISKAKSFASKAWKGTLNFIDKASPIVEKAYNKARSFGSKVWKTTLSVVDKFTSPLTKLKNMLFSVNTLIGTVATGLATKLLVVDPVSYADDITTSTISFQTMLGSEKKGTKMMDDIMAFAKDTPFDTMGVVNGVQQMMAYGIEAENTLKYMEKIGNVMSAMGKGEEGIDSVTRALGQMRSTGRVNAQDMMQLTSVGIKAWDYLAKGMGKSVAEVREMSEDGAIDAETAIKHIMNGLDEFDGMMDKMSNRTVKGLLSNIKDTFQQSIVLKWGEGLQKGAINGLSKFKDWLDKIDPLLEKAGTSLSKLGEALSTNVFEFLNGVAGRFEKAVSTKEFANADLGGKIKIVWNEVIWEPFATWWENEGKPKMAKKMESFGESLGTGISNGLLTLLGIDVEGALNDGSSIGASFADGFAEGFDGEAVGEALWNSIKKGFPSAGKGLADLLLPGDQGATGGQKLMGAGLGFLGLKTLPTLWKGGKGLFKLGKGTFDAFSVLKGTKAAADVGAGSATAAKILGKIGGGFSRAKSGVSLLFSKAGTALKPYALTGAGLLKGGLSSLGTALGASGSSAAAVGGSSLFGGILGALGIGDGVKDIYHGFKSDDKKDKKTKLITGGSKIGMVGTGALAGGKIGALIGSAGGPIGTGAGALIGAGIGGVGALFGGDKFGKWLSDATDEGGALNWNTWKDKTKSWYYGDSYDSKSGQVDKGWVGKTGGFVDKVASFKSFFTDKIPEMWDKTKAFFSESIPKAWNDFWDGVGDKIDEIKAWASELGSKAKTFFTETIPEKWDEFWNKVGEKVDELKEDAGLLKDKVVAFFTETIPEKWDEFWENVGEFFTETVPYAIGYAAGKVYSFFTETLPEKWDEFWEGVGEFFEDVGEWAAALCEKTTVFFTETLPEKWGEFWDGVGEFFSDVGEWASALCDKTVVFFTETIPEKWSEFWDGVKEFFAPVAEYASLLLDKTVVFFTETIPEKWNEFWDGVGEFFTETIPAGWEIVKNKVSEFFTVTIPARWNEMWDGLSTFFTEIVPQALSTLKTKASEFFTITIPQKWNEMWDGLSTFFTETIPQALSTIGSGITTFFTETLPGYFSGLLSGISSWISEKASSFWGSLKSGWSDGKGDGGGEKKTRNAAGGFIRSKTLSWLGEEGTPEVVIPLGSHRRNRARDLWERTGELLGIKPEYNARGGIVGADISETPEGGNAPLASFRHSGGNIEIHIGNITFEINAGSNPSDILAAIKAQKDAIVNLISEALYEALVAQFTNTPMAVG